MPEPKIAAATTDHVKGKDINGQMVILERTQPRQLSLFQTFLPDEERYSNTIDLYDLKVARKRRWIHCEPHQIWLSRLQVPARACRSLSL